MAEEAGRIHTSRTQVRACGLPGSCRRREHVGGGCSGAGMHVYMVPLLLMLSGMSCPAAGQEPPPETLYEPMDEAAIDTFSRLPCGQAGFRCCAEDDPEYDLCGSDYQTCSPPGICTFCGLAGQPCCPGGRCNFGSTCTDANICETTCGLEGLPCCTGGDIPSDACTEFSLVCFEGVCGQCGGAEQPCCSEDDCSAEPSPGFRCDVESGLCLPLRCGGDGEACCTEEQRPGRPCDVFLGCAVDGACEECGFDGRACCDEPYGDACRDGGECGAAGVCVGGLLAPPPPPPSEAGCGAEGEPCCEGPAEPCGPLLLCAAGECKACGDFQQPCCEDDYCSDAYACGETSGICIGVVDNDPCGRPGLRCCEAGEFYEDRQCFIDAVCVEGVCASCGNAGDLCCEGDVCNDSQSLCLSTGFCSGECGFDNIRCCDVNRVTGENCREGRQCDAETNTCSVLNCGLAGQQCCTPAILMRRGSQCQFGRTCEFDDDGNGVCPGRILPPPTDPLLPPPMDPMPAPPPEPLPVPPPEPTPTPPPEPMPVPPPDPMPAPPPGPMPPPPPDSMPAPLPGPVPTAAPDPMPGPPPDPMPVTPPRGFLPPGFPAFPPLPGNFTKGLPPPRRPRAPRPPRKRRLRKFRCTGEDCKTGSFKLTL